VRIPTSEDIRGHYVVREALESQAARLFAEKASPSERDELQEMAERLDPMYVDPSRTMQEAFSYHQRLHHRIAECTGCPALVAAIERSHILVLNWHYNSAAHFDDLPEHWHRDLVRVLVAGDAEAADRAMRDHVRFGLSDVLSRLEAANSLADAPVSAPAFGAVVGG
jgi:DNA-binding GntR family transcriptional regulator